MKVAAAVKGFCLLAIAAAQLAHGARSPGLQTQYSDPKCQYLCTGPSDFETNLPPIGPIPPIPQDNTTVAYDWGIILLNLIKSNFDSLTPPGIARLLGIFSTCLHDAIAQPTLGMKPVYTADDEGVSDFDIVSAVNGAAHQALVAAFGGTEASGDPETGRFADVRRLLTPARPSMEHSPSYYIGVKRCKNVIDEFTADGFDVLGEPLPGTSPTPYVPFNDPQTRPGITDCAKEINSLDRWQPLLVPLKDDPTQSRVQTFLAPNADTWTTFALPTGDAARPSGPPLFSVDPEEWERQAREVVQFSGNLTDVSKTTAEHWANGPDVNGPPAHFYKIAMDAGIAKKLNLVDTIKLYFLIGNAENDAGVGAWDAKIFYDFVRPITMIQCGFKGETLHAWKAPYMGVGDVNASEWQPYQATTFVTPAFSGYVSGHSTFSAAAGGILDRFFGEEYLAPKCRRVEKGDSLFEKEISDPEEDGFIDGFTNVPNSGPGTTGYTPGTDVVLCWSTWTDAVVESGISRLEGGIHVIADDIDGKLVGGKVAQMVYEKATAGWGKAWTEAAHAES